MIFCFNLEVHAFRYPRGYENEGLGGVCESGTGNPLASGGNQSGPKLTPILFASCHMSEIGVLTRTYIAEGQVPDCPDVTCA